MLDDELLLEDERLELLEELRTELDGYGSPGEFDDRFVDDGVDKVGDDARRARAIRHARTAVLGAPRAGGG